MSDQSALTTIRSVVNKARSMGDIPEREDYKIFQYVIDGMKDLSMFNMTYVNAVKVTPDSLGRISLPTDCLKFISCGVPRNGVLWTFTRDKAIVTTSDKTYATETFDTDYGDGGEDPSLSYNMYTSGGGTGTVAFYVNDRDRYVQLVGFKADECTLHYISTGITENIDGVQIPLIAEKALIAYAMWQYVVYKPDVPEGVKINRQRRYGEELDDLDRINYTPTKDEIMDEYYKHLYQGIKRI